MPATSITLPQIKDRLVGLDAWFREAAKSDARYDDAKMASLIPAWVRKFERETTFRVNPVRVVSAPDGSYGTGTDGAGTVTVTGRQVTGTGTTFETLFAPGQILQAAGVPMGIERIESDTHLVLLDEGPPLVASAYQQFSMPTLTEKGYDYYQDNADEFFRTTFRERPVREVDRLRLMFNGQQLLYTVPQSWFSLDGRSGKFWMLPYFGQQVLAGATAGFATVALFNYGHVPNFLFFDYVAGLPDNWQYMAEWSDVRIVLSEYCALQILNDISQAVGAGLSNKSLSADGISQSFPYERFMARKQELMASITAFQSILVAQETPFMMECV